METNEKKTSLAKNVAIGGLAILLAGSAGYNLYNMNQQEKISSEKAGMDIKLDNVEVAKNQLKTQFDSLNLQYDEMRSANDILKGDLSTKDKQLAEKDRLIKEKQAEIKEILSNENTTLADLKKAQSMIASLQGDIINLKQEITRLQAENNNLRTENQNLASERDRISGELATEKEVSNFKSEVIEVGSTLTATNFVLTGLKVRNSGKEVEKDIAKKINKLRVSFTVAENRITPSGNKDFYLAVFRPDGSLATFNGRSGSFDSKAFGTVNYTDKISVNYNQGTQQNVSFDWQDDDFSKGNYRMVVYQNGYEIGHGIKTLR